MSGTVAQQYLRPTLIAGTIRELGAAGAAASSVTRVDFPNLGTGIRQFTPEAATTTGTTIPAEGAAARNIGWRMSAPIQNVGATANPSDPVQYAASTWRVTLVIGSDTALVTAAVTIIVYVNGAEVGRLTPNGASLPTTPTAQNFDVPIAAFTSTADPKIQVEAYLNVTIGGTNLNGVKITLATGGSSSSITPSGIFTVRASRTPPAETLTSPTDTTTRVVAAVRRPAETTAFTDSTIRVASVVRSATDTHAGLVDAAAKTVTYRRSPSELLAAATDTIVRVTQTVRRTAETFAPATDNTVRVTALARRLVETIAVIDTPSRTTAAVRVPAEMLTTTDLTIRAVSVTRRIAESVAAITDIASRVTSLKRTLNEVLAMTDIVSRLAVFPRATVETVTLTDTASRVYLANRNANDVIAVPLDNASRGFITSRQPSQTLPVLIDTPSKLVTYGRTVRYQFQPGDEPLVDVTKSIAGTVRTTDGQVYLGGATVVLFRTDTNIGVRVTTSSTSDGSYSFPRNSYDTFQYYVAAFITTPAAQQAVSERNLVAT